MIRPNLEISSVLGVSRGGLIPATILAHELEISSENVSSVHSDDYEVNYGNHLVIVDEICDTGRTFARLKVRYPNAVYVSVYVKPAGLVYCDHFLVPVPQDVWIILPWETKDSTKRVRV
jgi:xanthine phosphoribosyltransferase